MAHIKESKKEVDWEHGVFVVKIPSKTKGAKPHWLGFDNQSPWPEAQDQLREDTKTRFAKGDCELFTDAKSAKAAGCPTRFADVIFDQA